MDLFKAQLGKLQQQLSGLTASQKMLAAALTAIMAMTLVWWGRYAGEAEYQPLLNQSFSTDDIASITTHLDTRGIKYTVTGDRIMVPADRKLEILGDLGFAHLLPNRTDTGFDDIVKQMTPWDSEDKTGQMWVEAKQRELEAVIGTFPSVRDATVIIDTHEERRFDAPNVQPSAMVNVVTDSEGGGMNVRKLATGAGNLVAGAVAGMMPSQVTVVVDGATIPVADKGADGMPDGDSFLEATRSNEEMFRDKIVQQLEFIKGLYVSVRVSLNTKQVETKETTVDPKNNAHLSVTEEEKTSDTTGAGGGAEPGAASNLTTNGAIAIGGGGAAGGGGGGGNSTTDETKNTYENRFGEKVQTTVQGPGEATPISASVRVPRSYFIAMYKDLNKGADPDEAALDALVKTEEGQIRQDVKSCTGIASDDAVTVNWYSDTALKLLPEASPGAVKIPPVSVLLVGHLREIGVGVLALASMFMVMMMVRKGAPAAPAEDAEENKPPEKPAAHLGAETQVAGEVSEGEKSLDGMELDSESIQTQQVIEQVSDMVTENPDAAANLVKRWLNR